MSRSTLYKFLFEIFVILVGSTIGGWPAFWFLMIVGSFHNYFNKMEWREYYEAMEESSL